MVTRRVRKALYKIGRLLIADGIEPGSDLYDAFWTFYTKFMKHYHMQMRVRLPKGKRRIKPMQFKASRKAARELQAKQILKITKKSTPVPVSFPLQKFLFKKIFPWTRIVSKLKRIFKKFKRRKG